MVVWPRDLLLVCSGTILFLSAKSTKQLIPAKMQQIVGDDGWLQIFQESGCGEWAEDTFVRLIPGNSNVNDLLACTALPSSEKNDYYECTARTHAPIAHRIVGWDEHVDMPAVGDDNCH